VGTQWIEGSAGDAIAADDTFFPIVVATFFGAVSEPAIERYFGWLHRMQQRAVSESVPLVNVTDAGPAGVPSARVRRLIAEQTLAWGAANDKANVLVTSWVVVDNAAIRSVLRVLEWLHGSLKNNYVRTGEIALAGAISDLEAAGMPAPEGLDPARWERPSRLAQKLG
jgi:hypothetical protein